MMGELIQKIVQRLDDDKIPYEPLHNLGVQYMVLNDDRFPACGRS